jgi:hypothetical protein
MCILHIDAMNVKREGALAVEYVVAGRALLPFGMRCRLKEWSDCAVIVHKDMAARIAASMLA